ncbi:TerB family tellurite resistance protein [Aureimonas phyllosphaerae]|uniref:TerB family tellurite resistance protein n=1 Tax=Aureimonas phyllosphaerae TaxID=1166078 RepID=UPI003A5C0BA7
MLASLKQKLLGGASRLSGRTDALEAVCAAAALVAAADGDIAEKEIAATLKAIKANASLAAAFDARTIETVAQRMLDRAEGGRVGRMGLYKEIEQISADAEIAELVLLAAVDVSEADGTIQEAERKVLEEVAKRLGLSLASVGL